VLVDGDVEPVAGVFEEVGGHPVVFALAGDVIDVLADVVAEERGAAGAGAA